MGTDEQPARRGRPGRRRKRCWVIAARPLEIEQRAREETNPGDRKLLAALAKYCRGRTRETLGRRRVKIAAEKRIYRLHPYAARVLSACFDEPREAQLLRLVWPLACELHAWDLLRPRGTRADLKSRIGHWRADAFLRFRRGEWTGNRQQRLDTMQSVAAYLEQELEARVLYPDTPVRLPLFQVTRWINLPRGLRSLLQEELAAGGLPMLEWPRAARRMRELIGSLLPHAAVACRSKPRRSPHSQADLTKSDGPPESPHTPPGLSK